ncbi:hypothetical protein KIN20_009665 [Parelaphostrongylus tenuis]|uniref:Uncharacterized protein n=1 Tax=Parelaphostrongylus tenuis TaxID=148309 RepID=A0AAD5MQW1_PARTN|nr:hypothetical protein KIN20_009665 [Parelaphostrongylus tenuis]
MTDATDNSEMANKEKITGIDGLDTVKKAKLSLNVERKISDVHGARAASTKSAVSPVIGRSTPSLLSSGQSTKLGNHTSVSMVTATSAPRSLSRKCCSELVKPRRPLHRQRCNKWVNLLFFQYTWQLFAFSLCFRCDVSLSSASPSSKTITMKANITKLSTACSYSKSYGYENGNSDETLQWKNQRENVIFLQEQPAH